MHVVCPKCERPLTKANSWHYCKKTSIDSLFESKPKALKAVFEKLKQEVNRWPGVSASATKTCIVFITVKTFLVVKVMKQELDLKFVLPNETNAFPIYKQARYGNKLEHYIRLREADDLDSDVLLLLRQSYELTKELQVRN
jgi:hypothetical protein